MELSKLAYDLTMSTVEVEKVVKLKDEFANMVIGVVKEVNPHPNADKLVVCQVDVGDEEVKEIVCGGSNLSVGMKAAVARPGAMVRWHGEGELVELKKTKVRGIESYGMICASSELGLFDLFPFVEESEIMDLSEFEAAAGTCLARALGLDDVILEVDNKSLTNRPDLWGHYGIAREIAAIYDLPIKEYTHPTTDTQTQTDKPTQTAPDTQHQTDKPTPDTQTTNPALPAQSGFKITIEDTALCHRYIGVNIEGMSIKPAPFWMQSRIWRVGMRPINAIVDITNYVMLATGQPTHAFDSDIIKGSIRIRRAAGKEKLLLLNGKELTLTDKDLVIADEESAVALAGVMGGAKDSILPETDKIVLEIANFDALCVRQTAMRYDVRTEAAARFEKSIDPERGDPALAIAMQLFGEIYPDMQVTGFHDNYPKPLKRKKIDVSLKWLEKRLGKKIENKSLANKLGRLGFETVFTNDNMHITVPTWRSTGDVSIPDDIVEEVARIHGFENFEPKPIETAFTGAINQPDIDIDRKIREYLAFRCGMTEIFTYPWVSEEYAKAILTNLDGMFELSAPPSPEERFLRSSLLPNLSRAIADNLRYFGEFAIFESAQIFLDKDYESKYDEREKLPYQRKNIAGAFVGNPDDLTMLYRKAKGVLEALPRLVHMQPLTFGQTEKPVWSDDIVWQNICLDGRNIGNLALLSKKASLSCGIKNSAAMLFELDVDALKPLASRTNKFTHIPEYPLTDYDVSLLFDAGTKWEKIYEVTTAKMGADSLLRGASFVEEYKGRQIPDGKKSVTMRLVIGSLSKTLTSEEIETCAGAIIKRLKKTLGAETR